MSLNISTGNMYPFVTHTWNTVKGACPHECTYCYMRRWGKQKPMRFDRKELSTDLGSGNFIFVGSSCDMWAEDVPMEWIGKTVDHCLAFDGNRYLFQTKNTERLRWGFEALPSECVVCTTIETNRYLPEIMGKSPRPIDRAYWLGEIVRPRHVTIEPIMDFDLPELVRMVRGTAPEQVNIGADSGGNGLPEPPGEKVLELISELEKFTKVVRKKNLDRLLKGVGE